MTKSRKIGIHFLISSEKECIGVAQIELCRKTSKDVFSGSCKYFKDKYFYIPRFGWPQVLFVYLWELNVRLVFHGILCWGYVGQPWF